MNIIQSIFSPYKLDEVFTPNTVAKVTYIKRKSLEDDLEKYITLPGKQIVLYGHSGSGKTTLIRKKLKELKINFIKTHCEKSTTFQELLLQAFDELDIFYISEKTTNMQYTISSELKSEYGIIKSKINSTISETEGKKSLRVVPPQLTPQKLTKFLGEVSCFWIIEDFHKVHEEEKKRIADVIKIFIDSANDFEKVKIICIGAVATARELIELDNNLTNRVAEISVPLLSDDEISSIIEKGMLYLNFKIENDLKEKIIYYSNNLASITHQICYDICYNKKIKKTSILKKELSSDCFKIAIVSYVKKNSDTFTKLFDSIINLLYGRNILMIFDLSEKDALSFNEILKGNFKGEHIIEQELLDTLEKLGSNDFKEIIRFESNSKKYSISSPFFKAFLKMKFALEKTENKAINKKRHNKRNNKYSIEEDKTFTRILFDDKFFEIYFKHLNSGQSKK